MPATGAIATQNPVVYIGGSELPEAELQLLAEIRVELELRLPGRVTLRFQDPDGALATGTLFGLGKEVQIVDEHRPVGVERRRHEIVERILDGKRIDLRGRNLQFGRTDPRRARALRVRRRHA